MLERPQAKRKVIPKTGSREPVFLFCWEKIPVRTVFRIVQIVPPALLLAVSTRAGIVRDPWEEPPDEQPVFGARLPAVRSIYTAEVPRTVISIAIRRAVGPELTNALPAQHLDD